MIDQLPIEPFFYASTAALVVDWGQTHDLQLNHRDRITEINAILGKDPSKDKINLYFVTILTANYLIGESLSRKHRKYFYGAITMFEGWATADNARLGIGVQYRW